MFVIFSPDFVAIIKSLFSSLSFLAIFFQGDHTP